MLDIKGVSLEFKGRKALNDISLHVAEGEFVSVLGPSGCGKTTLLRVVAGLQQPDRGEVHLAGRSILPLPPHERSINTVFQRYALFPHMTVYDNVAFGLRCKKVNESEVEQRVRASLELANLTTYAGRSITTLSGGEQQRVALVRALVNMPKLLLLDEPLGALDAKLRLQIQQELVAIQKRVKITFLFVTHDQNEALTMSDRIVVMNKARIEQIGTPNEIYELPQTPYVASFIGTLNRLDGRRQGEVFEVDQVGAIPLQGAKVYGNEGAGLLGVRPEKIQVFKRKPTSEPLALEAVIKAQVYLGTHTQFELILKNGVVFQAFRQNSARSEKRELQVGESVWVSWPTAMSHVWSQNALS